ncbi:hypothetical protein RB653_003243 [Dictyostelium firmibasis]|uniref:Uncharacterized protein n=1 Tax=Dictyostelium firmibasis TaxID=79012 RepID=A0AAN7YW93_9MYCE
MFNTSKLLQRTVLNNNGLLKLNSSLLFKNNVNPLNKSFFGCATSFNNNKNDYKRNSDNNDYNTNNNKNHNKRILLPGILLGGLAITSGLTSTIVSCDTFNDKDTTVVSHHVEIKKVPTTTQTIQKVAGVTTMGGALGYCCGLATRKIGTMVLVFVGAIFIVVQLLSSKGYIVVKWDKVSEEHSPKFTKEKRRQYIRSFYNLLTSNLPFKVGFGSGFLLGFKQ